jgi:serine phosphatase RsbU (regulator of sigma subunit)
MVMKEIKIEVWGLMSLNRKQIMVFELLSLSIFLGLTIFLFTYDFKPHENSPFYTFHAKYAKYFSLICTILIIIEAQYFWSQFTKVQLDYIAEQNLKISNQNEELIAQREEILVHQRKIERQNRDITDSINYAGRIQSILLPSDRKLERILEEYFILFKPKDIVSGDFFWTEEFENYSIVAVADCTGHGVPGAFVSVMGISFLSEIFLSAKANKEKIEPALFLNKLKEKLVQSVVNTESDQEAFDGMDISVCMIDRTNKMLSYSGALLSVFHVRNITKDEETSQLELLKSEVHPISMKSYGHHIFKTIELKYNPGDMLYLVSDGFSDQFGGEDGRKFLTINLKSLLQSIANKPMNKQKEKLEARLDKWRGQFEQVDDITILGCRL